MGRGIVKVANDQGEWYLEWSTVVDAPVTFGMTRDELEFYVEDCEVEKYNRSEGLLAQEAVRQAVERRLERLDAKGTTYYHYESSESLLRLNRAGKNETHFSEDQIIDWYCIKRKDPEEEGKNWNEFEE